MRLFPGRRLFRCQGCNATLFIPPLQLLDRDISA
jgi:hypothetical protein